MTVFEKIEAQQKGHEETVVFIVGEHLKDICRSDPHCAEIVSQDLENKALSIVEAEKKIKAWADKNKKGNGAAVPHNVAEKIIREFYGLPEVGEDQKPSVIPFAPKPAQKLGVMDLL